MQAFSSHMSRMNQQTQVLAPGADDNPLLEEWGDPFGVPAFDRIEPDHFRPAFAHAFASHVSEVAGISGNAAAPTFENTIAALEASGQARELAEKRLKDETAEVVAELAREQARQALGEDAGLTARLMEDGTPYRAAEEIVNRLGRGLKSPTRGH